MKKVFVSYKFGDTSVQSIGKNGTVRDYVDVLQEELGANHIYKGEQNDESLEGKNENTIARKLNDKIYDSSVTIILMSPCMKTCKLEKEQWIPREISYSLRLVDRGGRQSQRNGIVAVVLPDSNGEYDYAIEKLDGYSNIWHYGNFFKIIGNNMFNKIPLEASYYVGDVAVYKADSSYIDLVRWNDFMSDFNFYIDLAYERSQHANSYNLKIELS